MKARFRKHNGQRYSRKAATRTDIQNAGVGFELDHLCNSQTVEHVPNIKLIHILSGYDIDLCVPLFIQRFERSKLFALNLCEIRKIIKNDFRHFSDALFGVLEQLRQEFTRTE